MNVGLIEEKLQAEKLSVEEMRARVGEYCTDCDNCCLRGKEWDHKFGSESCLCIEDASEEELKRALALIEAESSPDENTDIPKDNDVVNRPAHYTDGKIEVIDFIEDKKLGFCLGNAIKYISRAGKKDPTKEIEDLQKAKWYVERRIKELESDRS